MNRRRIPIQIACLLVFLMIPLWLRLPSQPAWMADLYVVRFAIFYPMLLTVGLWLVLGLPGFLRFCEDKRRVWWVMSLLLLVLWMYSSTSWAFMRDREPDLAPNAVLGFGVVVLFVFALAASGPPLRYILVALACGLLWNSALAGAQFALQGGVGGVFKTLGEFPLGPDLQGVSVVQSGDTRWMRPYGLLPHPNVLGGIFCVMILSLVYWLTAPQWRTRIAALCLLVPGWWAFLLTFSRGAWLGFVVGAFALLPLLLRQRRVNRGLILAIISVTALSLLFFVTYQDLILARAGVSSAAVEFYSISERSILTEAAYQVVIEAPIIGVGAGNFPWRASYLLFELDIPVRGNNVHHTLLSAWAETGLIGLSLLISAMIAGIEATLRQIKRPLRDLSAARAVLLGAFIALVGIGLFDHYPWTLIQFQMLWWGLLATALAPDFPT